jgi:hypothetical protein
MSPWTYKDPGHGKEHKKIIVIFVMVRASTLPLFDRCLSITTETYVIGPHVPNIFITNAANCLSVFAILHSLVKTYSQNHLFLY